MAHDDDNPGFWPGYVAAVSGLVQGLLIMTMALGISIFGLGRLAASSVAAGAVTKAPVAGPSEAAKLVRALPAAPPVGPGPTRFELSDPPATVVRPMLVGFVGDAVVLPRSSADALRQALGERTAAGADGWMIALTTDINDPQAARAGYLRLMSVRDALLQAGIASQAIAMRLHQGGAGASDEVLITPLAVNGRPLEIREGRQ